MFSENCGGALRVRFALLHDASVRIRRACNRRASGVSPRCLLNVYNPKPRCGDTVRSDALMWQLLIRALMGPSEKYVLPFTISQLREFGG